VVSGRENWLRSRPRRGVLIFFCLMFGITVLASTQPPNDDGRQAAVPAQPAQPASGPGSTDYPHAAMQISKHGRGARQFWLFTPAEPQPTQAPIVVFLHGWGAMDPTVYGAWIKHLVRRGNIVVYPRYQEDVRTLPREMTGHAVTAVRDAIEQLQSSGPVRPDLDRFALVGHSMGAIMSVNIADRASELELPLVRAVFVAEPTFEPLVGTYDRIAPETLLVVAIGADVKRDASARRIFLGSSRVPAANKNYVVIHSDDHGVPPLVSDHFSPCAAESLDADRDADRRDWRNRTRDALDYFGYWKLCDGLLDAAFFNRHREFALGDTPELRFMGRWTDGTPLREVTVLARTDFPDQPAEAAR